MIKWHEPFQDGSTHAANEYCPTCHRYMDRRMWDEAGKLRPEAQDETLRPLSDRRTEHG